MTTIAASKRYGMMAGDTKITDDGGGIGFHSRKIWVVKGDFVGVSGDAVDIPQFRKWYQNNDFNVHINKEFNGLVLTKSGRIYFYDNVLEPILVTGECYAIGSGAQIAMYIMKKGGSPKDAVKAASEIDPNTGGRINTLSL